MRAAVTTLLIMGLLPHPAEVCAQESHWLSRGDRVKVYRSGVERNLWDWHGPDVTGTVLAVTADSAALLTSAGSTVVVPLNSIGGLVLNRGPHSNWLKGVTAGAVIGAGAGLVAGLIAKLDSDGCRSGFLLEPTQDCQDAWLPVLGMMGVGALGGGLVGAVIGSLIKTDKWEDVSLANRPVSFISGGARVGLAVSVSF